MKTHSIVYAYAEDVGEGFRGVGEPERKGVVHDARQKRLALRVLERCQATGFFINPWGDEVVGVERKTTLLCLKCDWPT